MYTVLIVDDEPLISQGVHLKIKRINHPNISEVVESNSPIKALDYIKTNKPNIVISDMKMPMMSGIELIHSASIHSPNTKYIILSGYDDYEFVRKSFQYGAIDYLLKPISIDELSTKLEDAIIQIKEESKVHVPLHSAFGMAIDSLVHAPSSEVKDTAIAYIKETLDKPYFQLAAISLPHEYHMSHLSSMTKEICRSFDTIVIDNYYDSKKNSILIFNYDHASDQLIIANTLSLYLKKLRLTLAPATKIALTTPIKYINHFKSIADQLAKILSSKILYAPYSLMIHYSGETPETTSDLQIVTDLSHFFKIKDFTSINQFIDQYFVMKPIKYSTLYETQKIYQIILQKINELFNANDLIQSNLFTKSYDAFDSLTSLRLYLKECLFEIQSQLRNEAYSSTSMIDSAIEYIDAHLHEDINMASLSNYLSLNYSYFSKLFKKTMSISFKKYLVKVRMEKAIKLLNDPTMKIYEVSNSVGYDNANNFSRAFKSHYGFSPKNYRNK